MKNILIVEDDPDIQESLADALSSEGYSVTQAKNGREGLDLLRHLGLPCLILLDMMMPVMDGQEFLQHMRADPVTSESTVLVITANRVTLPPGAAELLRKPFTLTDLLAAVRRHCA